MAQSFLPAHLRSGYDPFTIRRTAGVLLSLGLMELFIWLFYCLTNYYGGERAMLLPVNTSLQFSTAHHLFTSSIASPAGAYSTGAQGTLLYHATSLGDYLLFFTIGDLAFFDALFFAGLGAYLHRALRQLPQGREFTPTASRAMRHLGLATMGMFLLKMLVSIAITEIFWAKTNHLFRLATNHSAGSLYYCVFGLLLVLCGEFFWRGQQLQRDSELTI